MELSGFLKGFSEAQMRDARSASQWFPPESARESAKNESEFGALARTVFSPRSRCEPKISLAQTFFAKRSESEAFPKVKELMFHQMLNTRPSLATKVVDMLLDKNLKATRKGAIPAVL